ncbi:MAG: Holliday junction resolvase RuvX [Candidatus Komeilibacteria bacterium]|nr:Holliday junction resolvase RuvX [Candidatus Komeilibacteria bacterium]
MKNYIGIDYGSSKVGLALGDSETKIATPFKVIKPEELFLEIERLIERGEGLDLAIMGLPMGMNGQPTEQTNQVKEFGDELAQQISIPLVYQDERLSTSAARKVGLPRRSPGHDRTQTRVKAGKDDAVAAMYILQSYLDRHYPSPRVDQ